MTDLDITSPDDFSSSKKPQRLNIHHLDAKLAAGFHSDCENLLQKFKKCQNYSYTSFAQMWRESCFLGIFKGLNNILTMKTFVENAFFNAKKFLYSPDLYIQTGALYVLYGLYYKQPINKWVKVRLTQADVDQLKEIIDTHKENRCLEPVFIYYKMRFDGAFQYCALPLPLGLEPKFLKRVDFAKNEIASRSSCDSVLNKFKTLMEEDPDLVQFDETDEEYQKLSQKYKDQLFIFPSQLGADLKKAYSETFHVQLEESPQTQAKHITLLKAKATEAANATYRGDRKVVTAIDLQTPSTSFNS